MNPPPPIPTLETSRNAIIKRCVITVIAIGSLLLAATVIPVFEFASPINSKLINTSYKAKSIYQTLLLYAYDHDGNFPEGATNSNQALRQLFPDYLEAEKGFFIPGNAWHDAAPHHQPDDDIGPQPDYAQCLKKGENTWAYVSGLSTKNRPDTPLIADGFVEGQIGTYTDDLTKKGGVWKGKHAIVIFAGGGAEHIKLSKKTGFRVLRAKESTGPKIDIFTREGGLPENAKVLNPE